ncbi:hypothetical protein NIES2107_32530 [Nostoc carneum NIES-2107]|nr:hypothetical protein NIES2107_32530 [Nostoc carneum NIES-2107]
MGDRIFSNEAKNQLYVQSSGDKLPTGNTGTNQFWIIDAELPT